MSNATASESPSLNFSQIAQDLSIRKVQVEVVAQLLDAGNHPSFIARYLKDEVGGLAEDRIRAIGDLVAEARKLNDRKETILKAVDAQGKLTDDLKASVHAAETNKRLDDLFLPFKPKKKSLAAAAKEQGLEPLAKAIWENDPAVANLPEVIAGVVNPEKQLNTPDDVINGAKIILAEMIGDMAAVRAPVRFALWESGKVVSKKAEPKAEAKVEPKAETPPAPVETAGETPAAPVVEAATAPAAPAPVAAKPKKEDKSEEYRDYFNFSEGLREIPPHRILAVNRGERENQLQVGLAWDEALVAKAARSGLKLEDHPHREFLESLIDTAVSKFTLPSLEKEIRKELTEEALGHAVEIFSRNFRGLLLTPPLRNRRVMAIDPGTAKVGCKLVALDEKGMPLEDVSTQPFPPQSKVAETKAAMIGLVRKHGLSIFAIGNGANCREIEAMVSDIITELETGADGQPPVTDLSYVIANEAGATDYADSPVAREEFPAADRVTRGTISIGRRLQDPLAELVKIDPQHVGVGLYQHDVKPKHLKESIDEVIEACVNEVGVDVNTAGASLLRYVAGLNPSVAQDIVQSRTTNGPFKNRAALLSVPNISEARFKQCAAFLQVRDGDEPLDGTWIHPTQYGIARQLLAEAGFISADLREADKIPKLKAKLAEVAPADAATRFGTTEIVIRDLTAALGEPNFDPRNSRTPPVLKKRMLRIEDLKSGMEMKGTVVNVVPFGAFVDIGLKDTGLVHISRMANKFIKNPYELVGVGDVVTVWVIEIDNERKRASLTMVAPGQERPAPGPRQAFTPPPQREQREPRAPREPRQGQPRSDGQRSGPPNRGGQGGGGQGGGGHGGGQGGHGRGDSRPQRDDRGPRHGSSHGGPPRGGPQRGNRPNQGRPQQDPTPAEPPPPPKPVKPKKLPKLSSEALQGKSPLHSFGELEAFFKKDTSPAETSKPNGNETKPDAGPEAKAE